MRLFRGGLPPLAVDLELACCDARSGYALNDPAPTAPFHQLRVADSGPTVKIRETWTGTVVHQCDKLDRQALLSWISALLDTQNCSGFRLPGWSALNVNAVRARLPDEVGAEVNGDTLGVSFGSRVIRFPVEWADGALWVAGPLATNGNTAPCEVRITNEGGFLSLSLTLIWSLWIEADEPGRPDIEQAISRLSDLGWKVSAPATN